MSDTQAPVRPRPVKALKYALLGILLCAAVGLACFFLGRSAAQNSKENVQLDAVVLETQLSQINQLATVSYQYTNMAQFSSSNDFYGVVIPFTTKKFILTYDGEIKAGVDLSQAEVQVGGTQVTVTLPTAQILSHEIDEGSIEVFDEKNSIFNPFTVEDFSSFQADQKAEMEQKALERGLLEQAAESARKSALALLLSALPEGYTLTVKYL
ncbi:MAG: DUF4230 domain-containing protein [Oscillospiraceae bacterium]|nr:DUF4230 domain-containing protein [Oscillospiraceae bacterium]